MATISRSGSGGVPDPSRSASPVGDESLNDSQEGQDSLDVTKPPENEVESSLAWFRGRVQSMLRLRSDRVDDLVIKNADTKRIFLDFIQEPARRRLLVWPDEDDELHAGYDMPSEGRKKAIYFIKQRSFKVEDDGNLSGLMMGDLPCDVLEHLSTVSHEVLYPVLMAGRAKDPDSINKEISDVFHKFLSQVYLTVGQTQGKTLLPLPPRDPNQKEGAEARMVKTDKERVHVLESCVITWTQQIKNVLRQEPPTFIYPGDIKTGTVSEFAYWSSRAKDLTSIHDQLRSSKVLKVLQILEVTKSTYEKPFQKLVKEVAHAKHEASDIDLYLTPLSKLLGKYSASRKAGAEASAGVGATGLEEMTGMFRPALHMISLIYSHSEFYSNTARLQSMLEKLCNDVIHAALLYVNGAQIFTVEPEEMEERLKTTIATLGKLRATYLEVKAATEHTPYAWAVHDDLVFNLPDQFVERCYDMIDVVQMTSRFAALKHVQVGGQVRMARSIDQINSEFHEALKRVQGTGYDLLDVAAKKYDDDFFEFRRTVRDCERRLGSLIAERMESFTTLSAAFNFLACFEVMLDRKIILSSIEEREMELLRALSEELTTVTRVFEEGREQAPPYRNMPMRASRVMWCRSLGSRLEGPMAAAKRMLGNTINSQAGRKLISEYDHLQLRLIQFEHQETDRWLADIDLKFAEKLKQPLLVRDLTWSGIRVNFDQGLMALVREAKYFHMLNIDMPDGVRAVYSKSDVYQQHEANLHLIVNDYNALLAAMNEVEVPLMLPKLELVDEALEEGIELLNWRNHSIASFIKKSTSYIADASALLKLLQANVKRICELLQGWSTASLHMQRKKTVGAEEYLQGLEAAIQGRYSCFREDSNLIRNLIAEIHLALQVSRGDPAWRHYVAHVNSLIIDTLRASVVQSLEAIIAMLDPEQRKETAAPLVEVRLELVAPDVFFNPDVCSNLSGSGLEDLIDFWVTSTVGVANLLQRIDVGEGTYLEDVAEDDKVKELTATVRRLGEQVFEQLRNFKSVYENYSGFWLQEPVHQFAAFLADMDEEVDSAAEQLVAFDEQVSMLKHTENEIKKLENRQNIVWVSVDAKPMKQALFTLLSKWTFTYTNHLVQKVLLETEEMQAFVTSAAAKLRLFTEESEKRDAKPQGMMRDIMATISEVKKMSSKADDMFVPWASLISMLKGYGVQVPSWVQSHVSTAPQQWHVLKMHMFQCRTLLEDFIAREQVRLKKESADLRLRAAEFRAWFKLEMPFSAAADSRDADAAYIAIDLQRRIADVSTSPKSRRSSRELLSSSPAPLAPRFRRTGSFSSGSLYNISTAPSLASFLLEIKELNAQEDMFDLEQTVEVGLMECERDLLNLKRVWDLVSLVHACYQKWNEMPWQGLDLELVRREVSMVLTTVVQGGGDIDVEAAWEEEVLRGRTRSRGGAALDEEDRKAKGRGLEEDWKTWPVYVGMRDKLTLVLDSLHLMKLLQSPFLRQRHWKQLTRFTGAGLLTENDLRLGEMIALNLPLHAASVQELVDGALKESDIEAQLSKIEKEWSHLELQLQLDDSGMHVLQPPDAIHAVLDESLVHVQQLNFNAYVIRNSTFSDQVATLQKQLGSTETLLHTWMLAQHKHSTLHALFCTPTAREECAEVAAEFDGINTSWITMMAQAAMVPNVVETCSSDEREKQVKNLLTRLEDAQAQLQTFLHSQRMDLARFFLLSDEALLMLLSFAGQPKDAMPYLRVLFPGVHELGLEFKDNGEMQVLTWVRDRKGERLPLSPTLQCDGAIQDWVAALEDCLRDSVAAELRVVTAALAANKQEEAASSALQLVLVAMGVLKTKSIHDVLLGASGSSMEALLAMHECELDDWLQQLRNREAQEEERARTSAILIDGMGWRDVVCALKAESVYERSASSFAWQAQIRYIIDDQHNCLVLVGEQRVGYGCNFIGHQLSTIIRTESVRALQLGLSYAVHMATGALIQGSFGCGRSETLRGTAHALGHVVGVCVGSASSTPEALLDSLTGFSCAGMWTELRHLPLLPANVLSCLSQAARSVLEACRINRAHAARHAQRLARETAAAKIKKRLSKKQQEHEEEERVLEEAYTEMLANINGAQIPVANSFALVSIADLVSPGASSLASAATWDSTLGKHTHSKLPLSIGMMFRPIGMMPAERAPLVATWLLASGFRHAAKLASALSNFLVMCERSLSPAHHYAWTLHTSKQAIQLAASKLHAVPSLRLSAGEAGDAEAGEAEAVHAELQMLGSAVFDLVHPRLQPHDHVTFLALTHVFFFSDAGFHGFEESQHADATSKRHEVCIADSNGEHSRQGTSGLGGAPGAEALEGHEMSEHEPEGAPAEEADGDGNIGSDSGHEVSHHLMLDEGRVGPPADGEHRDACTAEITGKVGEMVEECEKIGKIDEGEGNAEGSTGSAQGSDACEDEGASHRMDDVAWQGKDQVAPNLMLAAEQLHLEIHPAFVTRCAQVDTLLQNFSTSFVLGPAASGKTSLIQAVAAQRSISGLQTSIQYMNPKAMPAGCLLGYYESELKHKWMDGVLSALLRDVANRESEGGSQQWLVIDAPIDPTWADCLGMLLPDDGQLILPNQESISKSPALKMIFESHNLQFASPSLLAYGAIVSLSSSDLAWRAFVQSWLRWGGGGHLESSVDKLMCSGEHCVIPQALDWLAKEGSFSTVVNEAVEHKLSLISMLCNLLAGCQQLDAHPLATLAAAVNPPPEHSEDSRMKTVVCTFVYSLAWSFGALLDRDGRAKFNAWVRQAGESGSLGRSWVPYPRSGSIFDYYFDASDVSWKAWSENLRDFRYLWGGNEDNASELVLVPTQQNIAVQYAMANLHRAGQPIILHGAVGAGKSCIVRDFLASLDPEQVICAGIMLNGGTSPQQLQSSLEVALEHKSGRLFAPMGTKRACFFIDDLHLPAHDEYGTQPVLEFLRHALDFGNWFDLDQCVERNIQNCSFIAAMPPSRTWVTQARLRRHFACLNIETPTPEAMQIIYETLAVSILRTFEPDVQRMAAPLAHSSVRILMDLCSVLMSTAERPHYFFTQHDLSKIFNAIQMFPELCTSAVSVAQLWLFNCHTTFMGRLVNQEDRSMCHRIIVRAVDRMHENLGSREGLTDLLRKASFLCFKQQGRRLRPSLVQGTAELCSIICQNLSDTFPSVGMSNNSGPSASDLEAMAALYHVQISHVSMALGRTGGHALLIGPGGGGKKTVATITARLLGYKLVELHVKDATRVAGMPEIGGADAELRQRLCNIYWEAGIGQTDTALVVHEHVLAKPLVATLISDTLAEGAFSQMMALFPEARRVEMYTALRSEVRKMGMVDSHENCWMLFTCQVQRHLHLVVIASTNGELRWAPTVLAYPLLLTGMSVCWFGGHQNESMQDFAAVHLAAHLGHASEQRGADVLVQAARHMTLVHQAAVDMAGRQSGDASARHLAPPLSPHAAGTHSRAATSTKKLSVSLPTASLSWYCQAWSAIYKARRDTVVSRHEMAKRAASKLEAALTRLSDLETAIEDQKQMVEQKKIVANRLLAQVGQETALLDEQRAVLLEDEKKQLLLSENLADLQQQLKSRVDTAAPLLEKAEVGLNKLEYQNISELRGVASPSDSLLAASRALAVILTPKGKPLPAPEALVWKEVKKMFSKVELFLNCLNRFNVKDAHGEALKHVEETYLQLAIFKEDPKDPPVVDGLKTWCVNIVAMYHIYETIKPQQKKLNVASKEWEQMATKVSDLSSRVNTLEARLTGLMGNFQDATEEKNAAIARLQDLTASCDIASKLAGALKVSRTNPIAAAKLRYQQEEESLLGDALVASALVTYAGWMDSSTRDSFMHDNVLADLRAQKISVSPALPNAALLTLTTPATVAVWKAKGLLESRYYVESCTIALNCSSWPVLIDPDGLGLAWLTGHVEEYARTVASGGGGGAAGLRQVQGQATPKKRRPVSATKAPELTVVSNSSADLVSILRMCVSLGRSVAIKGPLTALRREMLMLLLRAFYVHKRVPVVEIDGEMVEVHADFRLFLLTGRGRLGFDPRLANMCTIVNFTCSVAGLEEKILNEIITAEVPDMVERSVMLLDRQRSLLQERQHLEDAMLLTLGESDGIVLSDAVVSRLVDDLGLMDRVARKLKATEHDGKALEATRAAYKPVVETVEAIFQATEVMEQMHPAYVFSTCSFLDAVAEGLRESALELEPFEWHAIFKGNWAAADPADSDEQSDFMEDVQDDGELTPDQVSVSDEQARGVSSSEEDAMQAQAGAAERAAGPAEPCGNGAALREKADCKRSSSAGGARAVSVSGALSRGVSQGSQGSQSSRQRSKSSRSQASDATDSANGDTRSVEIPNAANRFKVLQTHMWRQVLHLVSAGMRPQDRVVFAVYSAISVALFRTTPGEYGRVHEVLEVFLTFTNLAQKGQQTFQHSAAKPAWLGDSAYTAVAQLSQVKRGSPVKDVLASLQDFRDLVEHKGKGQDVPWPPGWRESLSEIEKWVTIQSLRPDLAVRASVVFVEQVLGCADALQDDLVDLPALLASMSQNRPMMMLLPSAVLLTDVTALIEASVGQTVHLVTLGSDEHNHHCDQMIAAAYEEGVPIIIEGADRCSTWVQRVLDPLIDQMEQDDSLSESGFRLILIAPTSDTTHACSTSAPSLPAVAAAGTRVSAHGLSSDIMAQCSKIMLSHPRDPRADFLYNLRAMTYFCDVELDSVAMPLSDKTAAMDAEHHDARNDALRPLLFSLSILHAAMRSSVLSGAVTGNERLEHGVADLTSALSSVLLLWGVDNYNDFEAFADARLLPWSSFRTVILQTSLGALVTDPWEHRLFRLQLARTFPWVGQERSASHGIAPSGGVDFDSICSLSSGDGSFPGIVRSVLETWEDAGALPEYLSGLWHTALVQDDAHHLQKRLGDLRFVRRKREINRQDKAKMTLDDIMERLPPMLSVPDADPAAAAHHSPLHQAYVREIECMNELLGTMLQSLHQLELALEGQTRISTDLERLIDAFCHDMVPPQWSKVSHPSERALGGWFNDMVQRCDLLQDWCGSQALPPVVWLSGLFHPRAFITAVMMHCSLANRWPLAQTVLYTEVLTHYPDEYQDAQIDCQLGVRVHGFHLDKAQWDVKRGVMERAPPSQLVALEMPVIFLKAVRRGGNVEQDGGWEGMNGETNALLKTFACPPQRDAVHEVEHDEDEDLKIAVPVYRTQKKTEAVVLRALLPAAGDDETWILLGVAILLDPYLSASA